ncbi:hypothetical protein ACFYVL_40280 [Streptomyces sp. NPDC004111]|uniref:hypothetical protein n=1 Tax=Streptomyces sp. NPDC004111 TaxID=3364690 RepID=UPI0036D190B2
MKEMLLKSTVRAQAAGRRVRAHLEEVRQRAAEDGERGESPIQTVIIILAGVAGALIIAGALAALYAKYGGKLGGA